MIEYFIIGILVALMIAQNIFWAFICLKLTNRIMSRNYQEVVQAERKTLPPQLVVDEDDTVDHVAERQAKELNSIMGVV